MKFVFQAGIALTFIAFNLQPISAHETDRLNRSNSKRYDQRVKELYPSLYDSRNLNWITPEASLNSQDIAQIFVEFGPEKPYCILTFMRQGSSLARPNPPTVIPKNSKVRLLLTDGVIDDSRLVEATWSGSVSLPHQPLQIANAQLICRANGNIELSSGAIKTELNLNLGLNE